jgi:hypothetical protein
MVKKFLESLEKNAEEIRDGLMGEIRMRSGTWHYLEVSDEDLSKRILEVIRAVHARLGSWFSGSNPEATLFACYSGLGAERCREGIPLEEVSLVILLIKREIWKVIRDHAVMDENFSLEELLEINFSVSLCFDRMIQSVIAGYQNESALIAVKKKRELPGSGRGMSSWIHTFGM